MIKKVKHLELLSEYILIPDHSKSSNDWFKLELYNIKDENCIYPKLYASDTFNLRGSDRRMEKQVWFSECGWAWDPEYAIKTSCIDETLDLVSQYIECRYAGLNIPDAIKQKLVSFITYEDI